MTISEADAARRFLASSALFGALSDPDHRALVGLMRPITFTAGQLIFSRGDRGNGVYLVLAGRVRLSILTADGRELSLNHATEGAIFGEIAALDGGERSADATAISPVRVLVLSQAALVRIMDANPRVTQAVIRFLCERLRRNATKLEAIALHAIEVRLARYILSQAEERDPELGRPTCVLSLAVSQSEIGLLIGASRPKVNAAFAVLEAEGAIRRRGAAIECDLGTLRRCAACEA